MNKSFNRYKLSQVYSVGQFIYLGNYAQAISTIGVKGIGLSTSTNETEFDVIESEDGVNWNTIASSIPFSNTYADHSIVNRKKHLALKVVKLGATSNGDVELTVNES